MEVYPCEVLRKSWESCVFSIAQLGHDECDGMMKFPHNISFNASWTICLAQFFAPVEQAHTYS